MVVNNYNNMRGVHSFVTGNVSEALWLVKQKIEVDGVLVETRNGKAKELLEPCCIVYNNPCERVLFYPERDANPVFHFMESLWMLAGRRDVEWISMFNNGISQYSDDGVLFHAAYGHRWRESFGYDQIPMVVHRLCTYPNDRRAVLTMWDPDRDCSLSNEAKDYPCNTHIYFRSQNGKLDMTVCNRSNDMIWGAFGANVVHMSILQEYIAARCKLEVGIYTQITNNMHAYLDTLKTLDGMKPDYDSYASRIIKPTPLFPQTFDDVQFQNELTAFIDTTLAYGMGIPLFGQPDLRFHEFASYKMQMFETLAIPMFRMWMEWKRKDMKKAFEYCSQIKPDDWHIACWEWLERRQ